MQATIASFDPETASGDLLRDDGVRLPFTGAALEGSELRHLRSGQRVHVVADGDEVRSLSIIRR